MDKFEARVEEAIREKVFPGCVIGTFQEGSMAVRPYGTVDYCDERVTEHTVYDLASITKSIPLAALASIFITDSVISLNDKVRTYVPEIAHDHDATIEDLLRYRVKGAQLSTLRFNTFEEVRTHALERGFDAPAGESIYSNLPAFVLGIIIERVLGASLATLAHRHLFEPLQMSATTFFPASDDCAPTEIDEGVSIRGIPHDESARVFARARRTVGHAGLFSTVTDLLKFSEWLLSEKEAARSVTADAQAGLGWQITDPSLFGTRSLSGAFGKTGFTGTSMVIDPEARRAVVILSNRTYPKRPADAVAIRAFRRDIADLALGTQ